MEIIIIICLLIIIMLLAKDKIIIEKVVKSKPIQNKVNFDLSEIMGKSKTLKRHTVPMSAIKHQSDKIADTAHNFETEIHDTDYAGDILQEELDGASGSKLISDFEEESVEWEEEGLSGSDNGFATGVTYEELSAVGELLQQDAPEKISQQKAVDVVQKIQGSELFNLLENSIEGASRKIAELLDNSLSTGVDFSSSNMQKNDVEDFDIGKFV